MAACSCADNPPTFKDEVNLQDVTVDRGCDGIQDGSAPRSRW